MRILLLLLVAFSFPAVAQDWPKHKAIHIVVGFPPGSTTDLVARLVQPKLAESLGCLFDRRGGIVCGDYEATNVPGVFAAGNIIRDVQLSIVAAAEGARAAFGINRELTREDFVSR